MDKKAAVVLSDTTTTLAHSVVFWPMAASLRRHSEKNIMDRICARDPGLFE